MAEVKKILWPIDPMGSEKTMDQALFKYFKSLSQVMNLEIQPVHVVSPHFFVTGDYFDAVSTVELKENTYKECQNYLQYFREIVKKDPLVLEHNYSSQGADVYLFQEYTKKYQPDFVILASHGRKGWSRGFLGSFTENFISSSSFPVIVVGKECSVFEPPRKALMPVELSESSQSFVEGFLDDHRLAFLEKLTLFHKVSMLDLEDISWAPTLYGMSDFSGADILTQAKKSTVEFLTSFLDHPLSQKRLDFQVSDDLKPVHEVVSEIVNRDGYDCVVMRSESGLWSANILGSVTREVIRSSKTPVIVYPYQFKN